MKGVKESKDKPVKGATVDVDLPIDNGMEETMDEAVDNIMSIEGV